LLISLSMPTCKPLSEQQDAEEVFATQLFLGQKESDADEIAAILHKGKVKKMALANNDLGDAGAAKICDALRTNRSLEWLSLTMNKLTDAAMASFEPVIRQNETLKQLYLFDNMAVSVEACDKLWEANAARTTPMTDNLYGLVLHHKSPVQRERLAAQAIDQKKKKGAAGGA